MKNQFRIRFLAAIVLLAFGGAGADELKLKSGETITGRITYEADDIVKIEVSVSESIKETKIISRADIAELNKEAADAVDFARVEKMLPMASLSSADAYRQAIATGPDSFLRSFPESEFAPKVQEIRDTLAGELDQVERGYLKLEDEWVSPQDRIDFKEVVDSQIRFLRMESFAKAGNTNSLIAAMREYEQMERTYLGTPAFPRAVELAQQVIPILGRQLQGLQRDVDYRNAEYQKSLEAATEDIRARTANARATEEKAFLESVAADKKAGIKWVRVDPRIKSSIEELLKHASSELTRIRAYDIALLKEQSEKLVEVDRHIAAKEIESARTKLTEAAAMSGLKVDPTSKSKSKSKAGTAPGSYIAVLNAKIAAHLVEEQAKAKAKAEASQSEALAANLRKSEGKEVEPSDPAPAVESDPEAPAEASVANSGEPKPKAEIDEFAALAGAKKQSAKAPDEKSTGAKAKSKSAPAGESESEPRPPVIEEEEEGGLSFSLIMAIVTGLVLVTVVALKLLGIGGKKEAGE